MQRNLIESVLGFLVVVLTIGLLWTFFKSNNQKSGAEYVKVTAYFQTVAGVTKGTDVKLGGVKVGKVMSIYLSEDTLNPVLEIGLDKDYNIPSDSSFAVKSEGIMGGKFVSVEIGTSDQKISEGQIFYNNQSSLDLESIVSQIVFGGEKK